MSRLYYFGDNYDVIYKIYRANNNVIFNPKGRSNQPVILLRLRAKKPKIHLVKCILLGKIIGFHVQNNSQRRQS